jgi:hypothetical protein
MVHNICDIVKLSYGMSQRIMLHELNMVCLAVRFVPRLLSNDQKAHHVAICSELKEQIENDISFISTVITGEESCVYGYDPETKQQSSQWKAPNSP